MISTAKRPALPKGYRWLRTGERRVKGYLWWDFGAWSPGFDALIGVAIKKGETMGDLEPYIAPVRRRRKK